MGGGEDKAQGQGQTEVGVKQHPKGGGFAGQAQFRSHSVDIREPVKDFKLGKKQVHTSQNFRVGRESRGYVPLSSSEENSQTLGRGGTTQRLPSEVVLESRQETTPEPLGCVCPIMHCQRGE